ncbi:acetyltransferase [Macellibacteroides fermentans]|uniref:acetyltransferase n=1 Tax=Macellibacteroides fermentans TaxID=879969 RepID=UPI00406C2400
MKDIVIIGAGGFGREVAWLIDDINQHKSTWNLLGYVDDASHLRDANINGRGVIGGIDVLDRLKDISVVFGIGSPKVKSAIFKKISDKPNLLFPNLIHPSVIIGPYVEIGRGNVLCANSILTVNIVIKDFVTINLNCTIGHDVILNNFATVSPGVNLSGYVEIGASADIGTGTSIIQGLKVGDNTILGAGSVVTKNLPKNCTAVGIPAKPIRFND